ncbi:MAG: hypothetical protein WCV90_06310 [Candidatus Woesearchaeota archaeon]
MEKKLTAQGPKDRKSYTVTLPIEWVKSQHLDKTKIIMMKVVGSRVVLSTRKETLEHEVIDGEAHSNSLIKVLQGLYRLGVNEIKITYKNPKVITAVSQIVNEKLIGYEVMEQKPNYLILQDITRESSEDFEVILRRIFLLMMELMNCQEETQTNSLFNNMKKLINYCQRILAKWGSSDFLKTPFYYVLLDHLEKLGDEYSWINSLKIKDKNDLVTLKEINLCARKAYELFYKFDASEYDHYEHQTYLIKHRITSSGHLTVFDLHLHNLARVLNTIYGDIFVLGFKK